MSSYRQLCSDIINDLDSIDLDDRISYRFIISKLKDTASLFLKQDAEYRKLFKISSLWRTIDCLDMEEVPLIECDGNLYGCKTIMKSKKQIPLTYASSYGNIMKIVNLLGEKEYKEIRPQDYRDIAKRNYRSKVFWYFWMDNGYVYIPDSDVESVRVYGMFQDTTQVDAINGGIDVSCVSPLDGEFKFPNYIVGMAKEKVLESLAGINKRIVADQNPNLNKNDKQ